MCRLRLAVAEVRRRYHIRAQIEEVVRVGQEPLGLSRCQARSARAQRHHMTCLVAFWVLEGERHEQGLSIDKLKRQPSFQGSSLALRALVRLRRAA